MNWRATTTWLVVAAAPVMAPAQEAEPAPTPTPEEMKAEMRLRFEEHQPKPALGLTVNGGIESEVRAGLPWVIQLSVWQEDRRSLRLGSRAGSWVRQLNLQLLDAAGREVAVGFSPPVSPDAKVDVNTKAAVATWVLRAEQSAPLAPGTYTLVATLDSGKEAAGDCWQGRATTTAKLTIRPAPQALTPEQEREREAWHIRAELAAGNASGALQAADAMMKRFPESHEAASLRGDALVELGRAQEAAAAYVLAASLVDRSEAGATTEVAALLAAARLARQSTGAKQPAAASVAGSPKASAPGAKQTAGRTAAPTAAGREMAATELLPLPLRGWTGTTPAVRATHRVPAGWSAREQDGALVLTPADLPAGATVALVLPEAESVGANYDAWWETQWKAVTEGFNIDQRGASGRRLTKGGLLALSLSARLRGTDGATGHVFFFAARSGTRAQRGALVASSKEDFDRHLATAREFMEMLSLPR
jgi:hypothetical protein